MVNKITQSARTDGAPQDGVSALDAAIAEAAAVHLERHELLTTGRLIQLLLGEPSPLTARSDPGRRKQVERALLGERAQRLGIERVLGDFRPTGALGRPPRMAWRIRTTPEGRTS